MKVGLATALAVSFVASALCGTAVAQASAGKPLGQKLAQHSLSKKKFPRAVKAAQRVLALSGVATVREGQEIVAAAAPVSKWKMTARETVLLARGVRNRRIQLGTLAKALGQAGITIGGRSATQALPDLVGQWMSSSQWNTATPLNQPGIYLWYAQVGKDRASVRNLWRDPSAIWLSSLEAIVVLANIERLLRPGTPAPPPSSGFDDHDGYYGCDFDDSGCFRRAAVAAEGGPCASVSEKLKTLGPVGEGVAQVVIGEATGSALQTYANQIKDGGGDAIGRLMTGLDLSDRILRSAAFAEHVAVEVMPVGKGVKDGRVHKPMDDRLRIRFRGTVGLSKKARKELDERLKWAKDHAFQESIRNCAALHGVPVPRPYKDLAEDMENWSHFWTLQNPSPRGVRWYHPRRPQKKHLEKVDHASVRSWFEISIPPETRQAHKPKYGWDPVIATEDAVVKLEIAAQKPPSPVSVGKFVKALGTGVAGFDDYVGFAAELGEGLFRTVAKPTGYGTLTIEEHAPHPCAGGSRAAGTRAHTSC